MQNPSTTALAPTIVVLDGIPMTTSLDVAERFGKQHNNVLSAIREILQGLTPEFALLNFKQCFRINELANGKKEPYCRMTQDGFAMLAMGFTGKPALAWKERYIGAFRKMETHLLSEIPKLRAEMDKMHTQMNALHNQIRTLHGEMAAKLPVVSLTFESHPMTLAVLDGQPVIVAAHVSDLMVGKGVVKHSSNYQRDSARQLFARIGIKNGTLFRCFRLRDLMIEYGASGTSICMGLGLSSQFRSVSFITALGVIELREKMPEFYEWFWNEALPRLKGVQSLVVARPALTNRTAVLKPN